MCAGGRTEGEARSGAVYGMLAAEQRCALLLRWWYAGIMTQEDLSVAAMCSMAIGAVHESIGRYGIARRSRARERHSQLGLL